MLKDDIEGYISKKYVNFEASSGNTAKAIVGIVNLYDMPFSTLINRMKVPEVKKNFTNS